MAIEVVNRQRRVRIDKARVAELATKTLAALDRSRASVTIAFVRDRVIRELNLSYRGKDRATDVLSFPGGDDEGFDDEISPLPEAEDFLGDVVISTDTALRQAAEASLSFEREVSELVIHGILHLCGYDHETDQGEMNRLEIKLRRKLLGDE